MPNIAIIGATGAGKSVLAGQLAEALNLRHIELDDLFWSPGWRVPEPEAFRASVSEALEGGGWVVSGNYSIVRDFVWTKADRVIWLDYSFLRCFFQLFSRTIRHCLSGEGICNGNRESWKNAFFSRRSIFLWLMKSHARKKQEYAAAMADPAWQGKFVRLRSPRETRSFYHSLCKR